MLKTSLIALTIYFMSCAAMAEVSISVDADGGYTVAGELQDLVTVTDGVATSATAFATAMRDLYGGRKSVDFSTAYVIDKPVTLSIARDDGSVGFYNVLGPVYAYAAQDTFTEHAASYSLNGAVVYDVIWTDDEGTKHTRTVMEFGAVSLIKQK